MAQEIKMKAVLIIVIVDVVLIADKKSVVSAPFYAGLNPCYSGCCSDCLATVNSKLSNYKVLILVIVDVVLIGLDHGRKTVHGEVLILVIVDVVLIVYFKQTKKRIP